MFSSDEYDSEDNDQEIRLYTQLYFGNDVESDKNLQINTTNNKFSCNDQLDKALTLQSGVNANIEIHEVENSSTFRNIHENQSSGSVNNEINQAKNSSTFRTIHGKQSGINANIEVNQVENSSPIRNILVKHSSVRANNEINQAKNSSTFRNIPEKLVSYRDNSASITAKTLPEIMTPITSMQSKLIRPKKKNTPSKIVETKDINIAKDTKKCKRKRNPSICSIDSVSGREPLDNLYCQIEDERLDIIEEEIHDQSHYDDSFRANCSYNNLSEPEGILSDIIKGRQSKKLQNVVDISSDEEIFVFPSSVSQITPIPIIEDISSSSDDCVEIIKSVKQSKKKVIKKKGKKQISSRRKQANISLNDSDNNLLEIPKTPLVFRLGSQVISTEKKKKSSVKKFSKSCVIYSKQRPLTKRTPSCPLWTQEMATFYDSDYSDEYSVEDIHDSQNKSRHLWKICAEDYRGPPKKNLRYFEERCIRCREFGHNVNSCPRIPHCLICASADHDRFNCPKKCCLYCGKGPHKICSLALGSNICSVCKQNGHDASICPDLWRRFHATTSGTVPVVPDKNKPPKIIRKYASCYNCAKKGHFGHECNMKKPYDVLPVYKMKFRSVSTQIFSYSSEFQNVASEVVDLEEDEIEVISPPKKFVTEQNNEVVINVEGQPGNVMLFMPVTQGQMINFVQRQKLIGKEIRKLIRSGLDYISLKREENKIVFKGPKKSVRFAKRILVHLIDSIPNIKYQRLIRIFNRIQKTVCEENNQVEDSNKKKELIKILVEPPIKKSDVSSGNDDEIMKESKSVSKKANIRSLAPSMKVKVPLYFSHNEKQYLPVPLPSTNKSILNALNKILRTSSMKDGLAVLDQILSYFSGNIKSLYTNPEFFYNFQRLACIGELQLQRENKPSVHFTIVQFRQELLDLDDGAIDEDLHEKISRTYLKVAFPNVKDIFKLLVLANNYRKDRCKRSPKSYKKQKLGKKIKKTNKFKANQGGRGS